MATKNSTAIPKKTLPRFQLVEAKICEETIGALEQILAGARSGAVNGIAFAASLRDLSYITDATGYCREHPTFARGMVALLSDEIAAVARERGISAIR